MSNRAISTELIELGERIRKRRQEMKLSQESFAEKAGISVNTVSRIEGGQTAMSVEIFRKMIEILEIDANILLGKEKGDTEKQESVQEVLYRIQKMQWKEQKIIMCVWMVPRGFDLGGTLAVWTMNLLIGGLIGSIILLAMVGQAIIYLCVFLITVLAGIHKIPRIK